MPIFSKDRALLKLSDCTYTEGQTSCREKRDASCTNPTTSTHDHVAFPQKSKEQPAEVGGFLVKACFMPPVLTLVAPPLPSPACMRGVDGTLLLACFIALSFILSVVETAMLSGENSSVLRTISRSPSPTLLQSASVAIVPLLFCHRACTSALEKEPPPFCH